MLKRFNIWLYILVAYSWYAPAVKAQSPLIDSLQTELAKRNLTDSMRAELCLSLGRAYSFHNMDSGNMFLRRALLQAETSGNHMMTGRTYNELAGNFSRLGNFDSARMYYERAVAVLEKDTALAARIDVCINRMCIGGIMQTTGYHLSAIRYFTAGIDSLEKLGFPEKYDILASAYTNMGTIYNDLADYNKMLEYNLKALSIARAHAIPARKTVQIELLTALALVRMKKCKEAAVYLKKSDSLADAIHSDYIFAMAAGIWGRYYWELGEREMAVRSYKKSYDYSVGIKNLFQQSSMLNELGRAYYEAGNYTLSRDYFLKVHGLSKKTGDKVRELSALKNLSRSYAALNKNAVAVRYYQRYGRLRDSMDKVDNRRMIEDLEAKYENGKKEDRILILKKNAALQRMTLHRHNIVTAASLAGCVLLLLLAVALYINFKRKNQLLKQSEQLQAHQIQEMKKQQQIRNLESVLKGQEAERRRLAKDLHDGVGGLLSGVKLSLSAMGNVFLSESNAGRLDTVIRQLDESIGELRRVSHNMMPESLIRFGLRDTLVNYCDNINDNGRMKVQLQTYGLEERMDQHTEIVLFRIIQELLSNVIRHSKATKVLVQLVRKQDWFSLTVEDNGAGFDINTVEEKAGAGMANIRARAEYIGANIDIDSKPGEGTSVNVEGSLTKNGKDEG